MGPGDLALDDVRARGVSRHEQIGFESAVRAVCSECPTSISGRGSSKFFQAKLLRHRYRDGHSARLEALGRIERFVLHVEIGHPKRCTEVFGVVQRSPALAE